MKNKSVRLVIVVFLFKVLTSAEYRHVNDLTLKIVETSPTGALTVEMSNNSSKSIRVWQESNSWGVARWRVILIRNGRLEIFFEDPDQDFPRNMPTFEEIAPGKSKRYKLDINDDKWCGLGYCLPYGQRRSRSEEIRFRPGDEVVVSYDVPFAPESLQLDVWYGVATAITTVR